MSLNEAVVAVLQEDAGYVRGRQGLVSSGGEDWWSSGHARTGG